MQHVIYERNSLPDWATGVSCLDPTDARPDGHGLENGDGGKVKPPVVQPKTILPVNRTEVYGTVLFTEFLKELAAIAQEHSILSHLPMEE